MLSVFRIGGRPAATRAMMASLAIACAILSARDTHAATVLYRTDAQLVALSERVVHGHVLDVRAEWAADGHTIYTVARIAVLEDFTGASDPIIEVRVPGGTVGAVQMWIPGMPRFARGQEVVLCLERQDTAWRTVAFEFSTFTVQPQPDGDPLLLRDTAGSHIVGAPARDDRSRRLSAFRRIAASVTYRRSVRPGGDRIVAEARAAAEAPGAVVSAAFTLLSNIRWRQADTDTPVVWHRNTSAAAPTTDPNVDGRIQTALQAWTQPPTARITLTLGTPLLINGPDWDCPSATTGGGLITFEDPRNDMGASVLAYGGGCSGPTDHSVNGTMFASMTHGFVIFNNASDAPTLRDPTNFTRVLAHELGHGIGLGHTCETSPRPGYTGPLCSTPMRVNLMYPSCCFSETPIPPAIGPDDLAGIEFIYPMPPLPPPSTDQDNDTLLDAWEVEYGLDPTSALGDNGKDGDPDHDGMTNAQEQAARTHPRGFEKRYFAEGVVNSFFETQIALLNPSTTTKAIVLLRLQPQSGTELAYRVEVPPSSRRTVTSATLGALTNAPFATLIESDLPVVADRTMMWGAGAYGSSTETAVLQPATTWYLAEGATGGGFDLFYLLQNSNATDVQVDITYLRSDAAPLVKRYTVPARSRVTIAVDNEEVPAGSGQHPLVSTDVSAKIDVVGGVLPVIVERSMYYSVPGQVFGAGHESAGVPELGQNRQNWFFAEGATGTFFDTYILVANPGSTPAHMTATYLLVDGTTYSKTYTIPPQSRFTIYVDEEQIPANSGIKPLAKVDVSTTLTSDVPIIAERSMWWPDGQWYEAHNTAGATTFGTRWAIADGEVGGARNAQTFLLVANVSDQPASLRVTLLTEAGQSLVWPTAGGQTIPAHSRLTIPIDNAHFPALLMTGQRFGAIIDSLQFGTTAQPIVVERANYYNVGGVVWASGGAALASKLTP